MDHINSGMEDIAGHFGFNRLRVRYHCHIIMTLMIK